LGGGKGGIDGKEKRRRRDDGINGTPEERIRERSPGRWEWGHRTTPSINATRFTVEGYAIPEPSVVVLAIVGLAGLAAFGWRGKRRRQ